jgi:co-chaperonin GroES (HSP10)
MRKPVLTPVAADPADIKPLGDCVLVKRIPDGQRTASGLIWLPNYRNKPNPSQGPRRGLVVAVGPGDVAVCLVCSNARCEHVDVVALASVEQGVKKCPECGDTRRIVATEGEALKRRIAMGVSVGDEVIYDRTPANDISINGEEYVFVHEEQHLLAVIERVPPNEKEVAQEVAA